MESQLALRGAVGRVKMAMHSDFGINEPETFPCSILAAKMRLSEPISNKSNEEGIEEQFAYPWPPLGASY